jgi:N-acetylneuraminate synthase
VRKFSLNEDSLRELSRYTSFKGAEFASTPYSLDEALFLVSECNVPFIKVASMDLNNIPFLAELAKLDVPIVLSTGMGTLSEIKEAVDTITAHHEQLVILHCTSIYPTPADLVQLRNISGLQQTFPRIPIGFSDHTLGSNTAIAAIALGACMVEKHFTLDNSRIGMDNQMAAEPDTMKALVDGCHRIHQSLGGTERVLFHQEKQQAMKMRRSLVLKHDLTVGSTLTREDIEAKRPGTGIAPNQLHIVLGKTLAKNQKKGEVLTLDALT